MITIRSKVRVTYLYTRIKYKSITVYIKTKKRRGAYIVLSKRALHFTIFPKNKQSKLRQTKKYEIKEESYLNLCNCHKICFLFHCLFIFHLLSLLNIHKKCVCFTFNLKPIHSLSATSIAQKGRGYLWSIQFWWFNVIILQSLPLLHSWVKKNQKQT